MELEAREDDMFWPTRREEEGRHDRRCTAPVMARLKGERDGFRRVEDIGKGGFRLVTGLGLRHGERVRVRLRFPELWEELELEARVAWSDRSGVAGFDLRDVEDDEAAFLAVLIAHQEVLGRT
jgi:hypothetical protein